jgi:hypothetical protein
MMISKLEDNTMAPTLDECRPITITSFIFKLMELLIQKRIKDAI